MIRLTSIPCTRSRWDAIRSCLTALLAVSFIVAWHASYTEGVEPPDGQHDFDWEIGAWKTQLRRLENPLAGSSTWVDYEGTSVVREVWGGRANLLELDVEGPSGRIEGLSLRLYDPRSRQWGLYYSNSATGTVSEPVFGEFRNGRGEFHGPEMLDGRAILVRFVITPVSADSWRFEQAFSEDGGNTWEVNWIAIDTRLPDASGETH